MKPQLIAVGAVAAVAAVATVTASAFATDLGAEHGAPASHDAYRLTTSASDDGGLPSLPEQLTKVFDDLFGTSTTPGVFDDLFGINGGSVADVTAAEDTFNLDLNVLEGIPLIKLGPPPLEGPGLLGELGALVGFLVDRVAVVGLSEDNIFNQLIGLAEEGLDDLVPKAYDADYSGTFEDIPIHGLEVGQFSTSSATAFIDHANLDADLLGLFDPGSLS